MSPPGRARSSSAAPAVLEPLPRGIWAKRERWPMDGPEQYIFLGCAVLEAGPVLVDGWTGEEPGSRLVGDLDAYMVRYLLSRYAPTYRALAARRKRPAPTPTLALPARDPAIPPPSLAGAPSAPAGGVSPYPAAPVDPHDLAAARAIADDLDREASPLIARFDDVQREIKVACASGYVASFTQSPTSGEFDPLPMPEWFKPSGLALISALYVSGPGPLPMPRWLFLDRAQFVAWLASKAKSRRPAARPGREGEANVETLSLTAWSVHPDVVEAEDRSLRDAGVEVTEAKRCDALTDRWRSRGKHCGDGSIASLRRTYRRRLRGAKSGGEV
jgi:hypothetical protein